MKLSVVLVSYDRRELAEKTLLVLAVQENAPEFEVILVDDGSQDSTRTLRGHFPDMRYFYLQRPGWSNPSRALNVGLRQARGEHVLIGNAECVFADNAGLRRMWRAHQEAGEDAWIFPQVWNSMEVKGMTKNEEYVYQQLKVYNGPGRHHPYSWLSLVKRERLMAINGWDEDFEGPCYDDNDLADRMLATGARPVYRDEIIVYHQMHSTARPGATHQDTERLYRQKIGTDPVRNQGREWGKLDFPEGRHPADG